MADKPKFNPNQPFDVPSKPKFDPSQSFQPLETEAPNVLNEPSDIPALQRLAVKNFGGSQEDQVKYLQQNNPELEVRSVNNEIVARKKGEKDFKKLDPGGFTLANLKDFPADVGDVLGDIASGAVSTAAGGAAGLGAGVSSGGIGAIPAAMGASGATSAGLEAVRQKIGQYLGTAGEFNKGDVALSGGLGALGPLLFGTGASKGAINAALADSAKVGKILNRESLGYLAKEAAPSAEQVALAGKSLAESQKGLLGRLGGKAMSIFSGAAPDETIKTATKEVSQPIISQLVDAGLSIDPNKRHTTQEIAIALKNQEMLGGFGEVAANTFYDALDKSKKEIGDKIAQGLEKSGQTFDLSSLQKPFEKVIEKANQSNIPALREQADAAGEILAKYFKPIQEGAKPEVTATEAHDIVKSLSNWIDYSKSPIALDKKDAAGRQLRNIVMDARDQLQNKIYDSIETSKDDNLRGLYKENRDFLRQLFPKFKDPETAAKTLSNINNKSNVILKERLTKFDKKQGTNLVDLGNLADVSKFFGDPSLEAVSSGGATSTGKILRAGNLMGAAGEGLGFVLGGPVGASVAGASGRGIGGLLASPAAVGKYLQGKTAVNRGLEKLGLTGAAEAVQELPQAGYQYIWPMMKGNNK